MFTFHWECTQLLDAQIYIVDGSSPLLCQPLRQNSRNRHSAAPSDSPMSYSDTARSRRTLERTRNNESIVQQDLVNVLQHLDRDADGRLSFDEFAQGISRLGINLHEGELQAIWHQVESGSAGAQHPAPSTPGRINPHVIHPQPPSAYNPRDLRASSEIIMHSPGDSDQQRVPTHVVLRELSSQKEKEKTKMQETAISRLLRRSLAERPLMFATAFAKVAGANADSSSADALVRNSAKLQLNYSQFREGLRASGMGLGDEDFEMIWNRCTLGRRETVSLGRLARTLGHAPNATQQQDDGDTVAPESLVNGQVMSHELQENVARQRLTQRMLQVRGDIARQLHAAAGQTGSIDESTFGQVLAASGVQLSSADRSWFWSAMSGGQSASPAVIASALENLHMPIEEAGALLDGPSSQRPHLRTALGRGLVNYNDAGEVNAGEDNESMGKVAATKAFAAQRVKDALLTELPKVSRLFLDAPNGLSFSDFFHGLAINGVRLSEADASQVWLQMAPSIDHPVKAAVAREVLGLPSPQKIHSRTQVAPNEMRDRIADGKLRSQLAQRVREVKLMFDQYEEHGVHALDAKQLQVPTPVTSTKSFFPSVQLDFFLFHSQPLQVGLSSIGMFLGNSDTRQLFTAIGSSGVNGCITFSDISTFVAEETELSAGGGAADVMRPEVAYPKLTAKLLASLTAQQFGTVKKSTPGDSQSHASSASSHGARAVFAKLAASGVANPVRFKHLFTKFDLDRNGRVSHSELRQALNQADAKLSRQDLVRLVNLLDPNNNGYVYYEALADTLSTFEKASHENTTGCSESVAGSVRSHSSQHSAFGSTVSNSGKSERDSWIKGKPMLRSLIDVTRESGVRPDPQATVVLRLASGAPVYNGSAGPLGSISEVRLSSKPPSSAVSFDG